MQRNLFFAILCGGILLIGATLALWNNRSIAQPQPAVEPRNGGDVVAAAPNLPVTQVVLFSSGVGFFQREGKVTGNARVDLTFPVQDINDLIKSMVVRDLDGGHITAVSYDNNAPIDRTLKSFAINLTGNPSFAAILTQARGEKVEVVLTQTNATLPGTMTGTVVGIEKQRQAVGSPAKDIVEVEVLNLWCADGMRAIKLSELQRLRFLNPVIDSEFKKALETLATSHDTQKKAVSIQCVGDGTRRVKVDYVVENPIWKTSYRLVLEKAAEQATNKAQLQGWAVVENSTDEDWKDVRMALISGRPISFQMDLYSPLFVDRPTEKLELFQSLRAVAYSGALLKDAKEEIVLNALNDAEKKPASRPSPYFNLGTAGCYGGAGGVPMPAPPSPQNTDLRVELGRKMNLGESVQSAASASKLGNFFQYLIEKPVQLPRQKSALLPIVAKEVEGKRVSIYNERTHAKFPLLGLQMKNTSGLHLMQGPITVIEGSVYAGDARIADLQPNEERLISYAVDLGTEVDAKPSSDNGRITNLKVVKGLIYQTTKIRESKVYTITNRNDVERTLLIEHPVRNEFKLVDTDKPSETAADVYRFAVKVPAGKTETKTITEERILQTTLNLADQGDEQIRFFLSQPVISGKMKDALQQAMSLRWDVQKTTREIQEQQRQLKVITDDQARLRLNLREMPTTAEAYKRYLTKFDQQETQIETYQARIKELQTQEHAKQKAFEDFVNSLNVE